MSTVHTTGPPPSEAADMNNKSVTRMLQHSILQLCNEHVGYTHKLQILGVLCMTIDDEQQELVIKVNNTLKRVNPIAGKENIPNPGHSTVPPSASTPVSSSSNAPHIEVVRNFSPSQLTSSSSRKGRKGAKPIKVQQVFSDPTAFSDLDELEEHPVTIMPEAPEDSVDDSLLPSDVDSDLEDSPSPSLGSDSPAPLQLTPVKRRLDEPKASGSARRKASQPVRDPQYTSSPMAKETPDPANPGAEEEQSNSGMETGVEGSGSAYTSTTGGLSLPVFVSKAAISSGGVSPINVTPTTSLEVYNGLNDYHQLVNGTTEPGTNNDESSAQKPAGTFYINSVDGSYRVKEEPQDEYEYEYSSILDSSVVSDPGPVTNQLTLPTSVAVLNLSTGGLGMPQQMPYNPAKLSGKSAGREGLTVRYTSTGPITVGANGKEVSNTPRIKDIILYNERTFTHHQKGAKLDTGYVIDKLGMDGRKRRRRAADDFFTPEELAEYLGQADEKVDKYKGPFKCEYCQEAFSDVTMYIQHTLGSHSAYICHQCGKSFTTKSSLLRHRPIHTGLRRFACSICKKTFYRKDKCKAHIKRHLGAEVQNVVPHIETTIPGTGQKIAVPVE